MPRVPPRLDNVFLRWFRSRTEKAWKKGSWKDPGLGFDLPLARWQKGMAWTGGASEEEVDAMERKHGVRFPPDFRLFLRTLRREDRPPSASPRRNVPLLFDWAKDARLVREREAGLLPGLAEDAERRGYWHGSWGPRPRGAAARTNRLARLFREAPRLLPISHRRYLLAEPCRTGNPVLSVAGSDVELFGPTLRTYLLREYAGLLGMDWRGAWEREFAARAAFLREIPFWGPLL